MIERWSASLREISMRQWTLGGAVLLIAVSGAYLLWPDAEEPVVIGQNASITPSDTEIAGLSAAAKRTALRNPFSAAHERHGEIPPVGQSIEQKEPMPQPSASPQAPPAASTVPPAPPSSPPILRGVVQAADGSRMAILARGTDGAALGIGDAWQGYTLRALSDTSAILDSANGTITLTRE